MNKQIVALLAAAGFACFTGFVSAAPTAIEGSVVTVGPADSGAANADCELLAEAVRIGTSSKVHAAYECNEATNLVSVAACHEGGSRAAIPCTVTNPNEVAGGAAATFPAGCSAATGISTLIDYKGFFLSSAGGAMSEQGLGDRCSATTVVGVEGF